MSRYPGDVRDGEQPRPRADLGEQAVDRLVAGRVLEPGDADARRRGDEGTKQAEVLGLGGDDLVLGGETQAGKNDVAARRRRVGERELLGRHADLGGEALANARPQCEHPLEVRHPDAALGAR